MPIVTFEQRRAQIVTIEQIDDQIKKAKAYARRLHLKAKNHQGTLEEKLAIHEDAKAADKVLRTIRMKSWDIEDEINAQKQKG